MNLRTIIALLGSAVGKVWHSFKTNHVLILSTTMVAFSPFVFEWSTDAYVQEKIDSRYERIEIAAISLYEKYIQSELVSHFKPIDGLKDKARFFFTVTDKGQVQYACPSESDTHTEDVLYEIRQWIYAIGPINPRFFATKIYAATLSNNPAEIEVTKSDLEVQDCIDQIVAKLKGRWNPPLAKRSVEVYVRLSADGTIDRTIISKSSGDQGFDSSAVKALASSEPIKALPPGSPRYVVIGLIFKSANLSSKLKKQQKETLRNTKKDRDDNEEEIWILPNIGVET